MSAKKSLSFPQRMENITEYAVGANELRTFTGITWIGPSKPAKVN